MNNFVHMPSHVSLALIVHTDTVLLINPTGDMATQV